MTAFRSCMHIYLCSLMLIFQYLLWPSCFCSVSSCPYQSTQRECCCNSSEETKPEQPSICCCANSLRYGCKLTRGKSSSDCRRSASTEIQCQTLFPTCDVCLNASQTLSVLQHQSRIGYWKQLALQNRKGLPCGTKPTVKADAAIFKTIDGTKVSK